MPDLPGAGAIAVDGGYDAVVVVAVDAGVELPFVFGAFGEGGGGGGGGGLGDAGGGRQYTDVAGGGVMGMGRGGY